MLGGVRGRELITPSYSIVLGAIAYAKEKSDRYVDNRDLLATLGGALMFQVRF